MSIGPSSRPPAVSTKLKGWPSALELLPCQPGFAAQTRHLPSDIASCPVRFDADSGDAHNCEAMAVAEPRGRRPLVANCHHGLGNLYERTGKRELAQESLTAATTMYREMDMRFHLEQATAAMSGSVTP